MNYYQKITIAIIVLVIVGIIPILLVELYGEDIEAKCMKNGGSLVRLYKSHNFVCVKYTIIPQVR